MSVAPRGQRLKLHASDPALPPFKAFDIFFNSMFRAVSHSWIQPEVRFRKTLSLSVLKWGTVFISEKYLFTEKLNSNVWNYWNIWSDWLIGLMLPSYQLDKDLFLVYLVYFPWCAHANHLVIANVEPTTNELHSVFLSMVYLLFTPTFYCDLRPWMGTADSFLSSIGFLSNEHLTSVQGWQMKVGMR